MAGVLATTVGYCGGAPEQATYKQVCNGHTGHAEAILLEFDPAQISYRELLAHFWNMHNPTTLNRQGPDIGSQYRSAIFYFDDEQKEFALASKEQLKASGKFSAEIVTQITPAVEFFPAEEYHQDYHKKNGGSCAF